MTIWLFDHLLWLETIIAADTLPTAKKNFKKMKKACLFLKEKYKTSQSRLGPLGQAR